MLWFSQTERRTDDFAIVIPRAVKDNYKYGAEPNLRPPGAAISPIIPELPEIQFRML